MTERITWETCPECGGRVAVGWLLTGTGGAELAVEFDCVNGCSLTADQLAAYARGDEVRGR